ncbi:hypothetical protein EIN_079100 [Entamoeba invadens IP1]|uniref:hypothetical protein n=1 Tax=Entamoeba invadens IP1 TaxID=370355 RepID=UPI0002C3E3BD|nr:hypothetical protein EIN_079100 [Entamoeba invadens IP1]ELP85008.1 hypothetical protein EIN_079100 [Entamoeba invadens IP1]|eukprot:XP_004184354.1 hypothetical protein EIN_079100 [Entamoeba invadens IP1]
MSEDNKSSGSGDEIQENYFAEEEKNLRKEGNYIESDDDEYYNQTKLNNTKGMTYQNLLNTIVEIRFEIYTMRQKPKNMEEDLDELDQFMLENNEKLQHEKSVEQLERELKDLTLKLNKAIPEGTSQKDVDELITKKIELKKAAHDIVPLKREPTDTSVPITKQQADFKDVTIKEGQTGDGKTKLNDLYGY